MSVWSNCIYYSWLKVINNSAYQNARMRSLVWAIQEILHEVNLENNIHVYFALSE